MSRVSVTGTKRVMDDVIETVHDLELLDLSKYDGTWEGFESGDPMAGAEEASEQLVTVRSLESMLEIEDEPSTPVGELAEEPSEVLLEQIRTEVNELDDRRADLRTEIRRIEEEIDAIEPFVSLGIDLDLLSGYDSLAVAVGEGSHAEVEEALDDLDVPYTVYTGNRILAAFAYTDEETLSEALRGATFTAIDVPNRHGSPEVALESLEHEREQLQNRLRETENDLESLRLDASGFILALEEHLSIEVQKAEAPLSFATTENSFVAEGWIPTERYDELVSALDSAVGDLVVVEELEQAHYDRHGHPATTESLNEDVATDGGQELSESSPPVVQDNPEIVKPFEVLTEAVGLPAYSELDPTVILFLTFPAFFGFMIGDVGYGLVYVILGYLMYSHFDSDGIQSIGIVGIVAGGATAGFGLLFGEIFGLHLITTHLWEPLIGGVPLHKGLTPVHGQWTFAWLIIVALVGVLHLNIGYIFEFIDGWKLHGPTEAILEAGSWLLAINGLWLFIFSRLGYPGPKPDFLFEVFDSGEAAAFAFGFSGFPEWVGLLGIGGVLIGYLLLALGPSHELVEFHVPLAHPLSYLRIGAELIAEVGLAFAVNLLFWGVYTTGHGEEVAWHFALTAMPSTGEMVHGHEVTEVLFPGLVHMGIPFVVLGVLVMIVGHFIVISLGVLSVGIQAIRLEYFEFFSKFYEGTGIPYDPFGYERRYTGD